MNATDTISTAIVILAALGGAALFVSSRRKGRWGINLRPVDCPQCGRAQPTTRLPTSLRQALWGGWSCRACGTEMDKWGRSIVEHRGA